MPATPEEERGKAREVRPETLTKRQATQKGCLPSLLGGRDKGIETVYREEKIFCTGPIRAVKGEQKYHVLAGQSQLTSKQTKKISVRTETNRNKICFGFVSVCFMKPKTKNFRLFRFVSVFRTYIKTTETNRTVSKQTETNRKNPKFSESMLSIKLFWLGFCLFWFTRNIETLCFG